MGVTMLAFWQILANPAMSPHIYRREDRHPSRFRVNSRKEGGNGAGGGGTALRLRMPFTHWFLDAQSCVDRCVVLGCG